MATQEVNRILKKYNYDPTDVISILQDVQATYRYLPREALVFVSEKLNIPLTRIYHLSTFFRAFSLEPRGRHHIQVCLGTACHDRGSPRILEALERKLKIRAGQTTPDLGYSLETVNCVGACALGPLVVVDGKSSGKMTPQKAERLLASLQGEQAGKPAQPAEKVAPPEPTQPAPSKPVRMVPSKPRKAEPAGRKAAAPKPARVRDGRKAGPTPRPHGERPRAAKKTAAKKTAKGSQKKARR
jgi:NADH-quinone oxidoreductase subunit E